MNNQYQFDTFMAHKKILSILNNLGIKYKVLTHHPVVSVDDYKDSIPFDIKFLVKTLVFRSKDYRWILAAVRGQDRIDYGKLGRCLKVPRDTIRVPDKKEIETELGFQIGGIGPFPVVENVKILLDFKIKSLQKIYCGAGKNDMSLEISTEDLIRTGNSLVCDITRDQNSQIDKLL